MTATSTPSVVRMITMVMFVTVRQTTMGMGHLVIVLVSLLLLDELL